MMMPMASARAFFGIGATTRGTGGIPNSNPSRVVRPLRALFLENSE
jgi:hypothetical protein